VALGLGMTLGNLVGGWAADRGVLRALFASFAVFAVMLLGLALTAPVPLGLFVFLFGVGAAAAALSPAIQTRLMDVAGESQTLAAAVNHSALNIGNALGAFLGGAVIAAGWGYLAPSWVGLLMCVPGVALALAGAAVSRRVRPELVEERRA
jgi:DHA1 family inner membrane transport protein